MDEYTRVCDYCKRSVSVFDGIVELKVWYHPQCFSSVVGKRIKKLSSKIESGQITAQEAKEYDELIQVVKKIQEEPVRSNRNVNRLQSNNNITFGKRVDTKALIESGELKELEDSTGKIVLNLAKTDTKVLMPGVYGSPNKKIIPYTEQKQICESNGAM